MLSKEIISKMPAEVRARAEAKAQEAGMTLEAFIDEQVSVQLSEEELDAVAGGRDVDYGVVLRIDAPPSGGVGGSGGVVIRF